MTYKANVRSLHAIGEFRGALIRFQEEASRVMSALDMESQRVMQWLERDRPTFWKGQVRKGFQNVAETRAALTTCRMRRIGTMKPSCYEEQKALYRAKRELERAHEKVQVVRHWLPKAQHELCEFNSRNAQLTRCLDGEIPHMLSLLDRYLRTLEQYVSVAESTDAVDIRMKNIDDDFDDVEAESTPPAPVSGQAESE